jgi:hypothetical protein
LSAKAQLVSSVATPLVPEGQTVKSSALAVGETAPEAMAMKVVAPRTDSSEPVLPTGLQPLEHASLILTSNLPFACSGDVFGDQAVAAAMIDRIVHHADVLTLKGSSYRLKDGGIDTLPSSRCCNFFRW